MRGSKAFCRWRRKCGLGIAIASLIAAAPAQADDPPRPDEVSAADAYRESIPAAGGPTPTGGRRGRTRLAPAVSARLGGGEEGRLLRDVATSAAYGAPQQRLRRPANPPPPTAQVDEPRFPSLNATSTAVGDAVGRSRLALLAALLLAVLVVAVAARLAEARTSSE